MKSKSGKIKILVLKTLIYKAYFLATLKESIYKVVKVKYII